METMTSLPPTAEPEERPFARKMRLAREAKAAERAVTGPTEADRLRAELAALKAQLTTTEPGEKARATPKPKRSAVADAAEEEVKRQVAEVLGTGTPPPPPKRENYVLDDDPERQANLIAVQLMQEKAAWEAQEAGRRRADPRLALEDEIRRGRSAIETYIDAPEMPNPLAFEDDDGTDLRKPGYVNRWVRIKDHYNDRVSNQKRVREHRAWGAEVICKADGSPLQMDTLLAMRMPIQREARRKIAAAEPGTYGSSKALGAKEYERLQQVADDENVAYSKRYHGGGKGVVHLQPAGSHGTHYGPADEGDDES